MTGLNQLDDKKRPNIDPKLANAIWIGVLVAVGILVLLFA
jgi:hypothetical protein